MLEARGAGTLVVNKLRGPLRVAAVRAPGSGDQRKRMLQDVARLTGGEAITEDLDIPLRNIRISDLGQAKKITIDKNNTVVEGRSSTTNFLLGLSLHLPKWFTLDPCNPRGLICTRLFELGRTTYFPPFRSNRRRSRRAEALLR